MVLAKLNCGYCTLYRQIYCLVMEVFILFLYLWEFGTVCCCGILYGYFIMEVLPECCYRAITLDVVCFCGDRAFITIGVLCFYIGSAVVSEVLSYMLLKCYYGVLL